MHYALYTLYFILPDVGVIAQKCSKHGVGGWVVVAEGAPRQAREPGGATLDGLVWPVLLTRVRPARPKSLEGPRSTGWCGRFCCRGCASPGPGA